MAMVECGGGDAGGDSYGGGCLIVKTNFLLNTST